MKKFLKHVLLTFIIALAVDALFGIFLWEDETWADTFTAKSIFQWLLFAIVFSLPFLGLESWLKNRNDKK